MRFFIALAPVVLTGCGVVGSGMGFHGLGFGPQVKGNGIPKEESRTVPAFEKVVVGSAFHVDAVEGSQAPLKLTADSNLLSKIKTNVKDKVLYVTIDGSVSSHVGFKLQLSTPSIKGFDASGASQVQLHLRSQHDLELNDSGSSHTAVDGPVKNLNCELSGASQASLNAKTLGKVELDLSGSSEFSALSTVDSLVAELSGASALKGGMNGNTASLSLSGASNASIGKFRTLKKETSGASSVSIK